MRHPCGYSKAVLPAGGRPRAAPPAPLSDRKVQETIVTAAIGRYIA
jgi:hypothetical protein